MAAKKKKKTKNYINNADLLVEIKKSKEQGKMTDEFAKMMLLLAKRYSSQGSYASYTYVEDMESYALMTVCKVWNSFNEEKSNNPFAYFTQTIKRAFWQYMYQEEKHRDIRDEMLMQGGELPSHTYVDKYEEKEFSDEFEKSIKDKNITPAYRNLLRRIVTQQVGYKNMGEGSKQNKVIVDQVCSRIESEMFDYEIEKTTPFKFISQQISVICADIDPSYKVLTRKQYEIEIELESYEENDFQEDDGYDE